MKIDWAFVVHKFLMFVIFTAVVTIVAFALNGAILENQTFDQWLTISVVEGMVGGLFLWGLAGVLLDV